MATVPGHKALTTGTVKVPSRLFKFVLTRMGVNELYVGRSGMKDYLLSDPPTALAAYPSVPSLHTSFDVGMMGGHDGMIWLFCLKPNNNETWMGHQNHVKWGVLPLIPNSQRGLGGFGLWVFGRESHGSSPFLEMMRGRWCSYIPWCIMRGLV